MKKLLLTTLAAGFCIGSYAQTEKGKTIVGGNVSFNTTKIKTQYEQKVSSFTLGPSVGFFVAKNTALGLGLTYSYQKNEPYSTTIYFDGFPYFSGSSGNKSNSLE